MITFKHVWNNINQQLDLSSLNKKYQFYSYKTKQVLPDWYHVDLLNDNDQILIEEFIESVPSNKPIESSTSIKTVRLKSTSKKKQLKTYITNRSFIITNKYSIPNDFYQQWEEGKMHRNTNNYYKSCFFVIK